jgi:hypothetical protein
MSASSPAAAPHRPWWSLSPERTNVLALGLLVLITVPLLTKVFTSDFGTHIAMGRYTVQNLRLPTVEFLNYTALGSANFSHEWGYQVLLYLVHSAGGVYAVSFLCWAVVLGIYLLIHRATVLRGAHPLVAVLAIFAFSGFLRLRIQPRPEIFTYLFVSLTIFILSEYYFGKRKKLIYIFPPLMVLWANFHGSYLIAFILYVAFFVDALARAAWNKRLSWEEVRKWVVPPLATGTAGLVLCGLNPYHYDALLAPLHLLARGGGSASSTVLMSISELTPVKGTGMFAYYKAAVVFSAFSLILGTVGHRIYLLDLLLLGIAFKGSWDSARAVSMMGLFIAPGTALHITGLFEKVRDWIARKEALKIKTQAKGAGKKKGKGAQNTKEEAEGQNGGAVRLSWIRTAVAGLTVFALLCFGGYTLAFSMNQLEYGVGLTEHKFSLGAAEFLRKNPIKGNMFNFFDIGGFLDWQLYPQALTFIDGRAISKEIFAEHQTVTGAMPGWKEILDKHAVTYIVTKTMDSSGIILPLIGAVSESPDWSLVYADGLFVIFVRNTPDNRAYIERFNISKNVLPQQIVWESYHYMYLGVSPIMAYQTMSNMYMLMGNRTAAIQMLKKALEDTDDPYLRTRLMKLEQGGGRP